MGVGMDRIFPPVLPGCRVAWRGCAGCLFGPKRHPGAATAVAEARVKQLCSAGTVGAVYSHSSCYWG